MRKIHWRSIIYILVDIVLVFGIALLSFLGAYHLDAFKEFQTPILIYCGGLTLLTVIALAIAKQYKTLYTNYGMADSYRTIIASFVPALAGLIVLLCVKQTGFKSIDIIGWAQANGRDTLPIPEKAKLDGEYVKRFNIWFDIRIIFKTVFSAFRGKDEVEGKK